MTTPGSNREAFLARVRQATVAGRAHRVSVAKVDDQAGYIGADGDLCAAVVREVNDVGGRAQLAESWQQARHMLVQLLRSMEPRRAVCWRHDSLKSIALDSLLEEMKIEFHDVEGLTALPEAERRHWMLQADVGITSATHAVAETGSLVMHAGIGCERVISLLPPVHIAVVAESQIVPDLFDALARIRDPRSGSMPCNVTLITGPSKTGDIELQLTTGVHGPGKWHVIVVRETATNAVQEASKSEKP
ncbi:MAG: Lactate utilization protein [Planctomycetota bacterium]